MKDWDRILDSIAEPATRKVLTDRIVETAVRLDGRISEGFFRLFASDLRKADSLVANEQIVSHVFSPIVREHNLPGLRWLQGLLAEYPEFLDKVHADHTAIEFENRLRECIQNQQDGEEHSLIRSIADLLKIVPQALPRDRLPNEV